MKSILIPTDFSNNSINAIYYCIEMLKDERCEFYFLNVQKASSFVSDDLMTMNSSTTIYQNLIETSKRQLKDIIKDVKKKYQVKNHVYHALVDYDNFVESIKQVIKSKNISLIVMGTKGATGAEKVIFGSNTARVMQRVECPVLAIPKNCKFKRFDHIGFPSDYLTTYKKEELSPLLSIAQKYNSKIDVLHMTQEDHLSITQENNRAFLDECFSNLTHEFINLNEEDLFKAVESYIINKDIDLLVMMSRKHSFLERLFTRHNVETFAFKVSVPFLVMHDTGN